VVVTGRLDTVRRLALRWRAEIIVGTARIPIAGLAGAGIAVARLFPGRRVTITGIVRRAYPTAIDQRFAIEPRSLADIAFDRAHPVPGKAAGGGGGSHTQSGSVHGSTFESSAPPALPAEPTVDLRDLGSLSGRSVEVSGLVTRIDGSIISLDDGTATGRLKLTGPAAPFLDLVEVGDPLQVSGTVSSDRDGPFLLVTDPSGVRQAGDPVPPTPSPEPSASAGGLGHGLETPGVRQVEPGLLAGSASGSGGSGPLLMLGALAMALLGAIVALAIVVPLVRRQVREPDASAPQEAPRARPTLGPS